MCIFIDLFFCPFHFSFLGQAILCFSSFCVGPPISSLMLSLNTQGLVPPRSAFSPCLLLPPAVRESEEVGQAWGRAGSASLPAEGRGRHAQFHGPPPAPLFMCMCVFLNNHKGSIAANCMSVFSSRAFCVLTMWKTT